MKSLGLSHWHEKALQLVYNFALHPSQKLQSLVVEYTKLRAIFQLNPLTTNAQVSDCTSTSNLIFYGHILNSKYKKRNVYKYYRLYHM